MQYIKNIFLPLCIELFSPTIFLDVDACLSHILESTKEIERKLIR